MTRLPHLTQALDLHLTDFQFAELIDRPESAGPILKLHLATCADCRAEVVSLSSSLASFRSATSSLATAEMPALQRPRVALPITHRLRLNAFTASLATAAVVFASVVHLKHTALPKAVETTVAAQTLSDDALLDRVQQDLATSIPPSLEPLNVPATTSESHTQN